LFRLLLQHSAPFAAVVELTIAFRRLFCAATVVVCPPALFKLSRDQLPTRLIAGA
jgi:hypothetical protein